MASKTWRRRILARRLCLLCVIPLVVGVQGTSALASSADVGLDASEQIAALQMSSDFGIPISDAQDQISRQHSEIDYSEAVELNATDSVFAGSWIDHRSGGVLNIAATDVTGLGPDPAVYNLEGHINFLQVKYSREQLDKTGKAVITDAELLSKYGRLAYHIDNLKNEVILDAFDALPDTLPALLQTAQSKFGSAIVSAVRAPSDVVAGYSTCYGDDGNAPLRGGYAIFRNGSGSVHNVGGNLCSTNGYCSATANAQSNSNSAYYLITAGHCLDTTATGYAGPWDERQPANNTYHTVGSRWNYEYGTTSYSPTGNVGDLGIITVNNPSGWGEPSSIIRVLNSSHSVADETYDINSVGGYASIPTNSYLCHTGATSGTNCGPKQGSGITEQYATDGGPARFVYNLAQFGADGCAGDSGGPVFLSGVLYGIWVAYVNQGGFSETGANGVQQPCGGTSYYQGIGQTQADMNVHVLLH